MQVREAKSSLAHFTTKVANLNVQEVAKWKLLTAVKHRVKSTIREESIGSPDLVCQGKQRYLDFNMNSSDFQRLATNSNFLTLCKGRTPNTHGLYSDCRSSSGDLSFTYFTYRRLSLSHLRGYWAGKIRKTEL